MANNRIGAVFVCHNPAINIFAANVSRVLPYVDHVIIIDNASLNQDSLHKNVPQNDSVHFIAQELNTGVAAAFNTGIKVARTMGLSYVLLMDQDSNPAPDMISKLLSAYYLLLNNNHLVSAVGPACKDPVTGNVTNFIISKSTRDRLSGDLMVGGCLPVDYLISSGSLILLDAIEIIGNMDESLFIDRVDTEWFFRASAKGYQAFGIPDAIMLHLLGDKTRKIWLGRWRHVPQHNPFRYYYIFRNSILLYKRIYIPLKWKLDDLVVLLYLLIFGMIVMPERFKRLCMITRGVIDGILGKTGKLTEDVNV
jgi:rhamnosyltransferase